MVWMLKSMVRLAFETSVQWTPPLLPPVRHCKANGKALRLDFKKRKKKETQVHSDSQETLSPQSQAPHSPRWSRSPPCQTWRARSAPPAAPRPRCPAASEASLRWSRCWWEGPSCAGGRRVGTKLRSMTLKYQKEGKRHPLRQKRRLSED